MDVKPGYKQTEAGVLPEDWGCEQLPALLARAKDAIKIGPFGSALKKELLVEKGYKVYGQENIYKRDMGVGNRYISTSHFQKLRSCQISEGDFLISMMGTIGKCFVVPADIEPGIMDSHLIRLKLDDSKLTASFLSQLFQTRVVSDQLRQLSVGGIMEGLSSKIVKLLNIPTPTIKEQAAIVEALSDVDAFIESLKQLIGKKRYIKLGAMQELLYPKKGWVIHKLGDICTLSKDRFDPLSSNIERICIELEHLSSGTGRLLGSFTTKGLRSQKAVFQKGDILFGKLRPYLRKYWRATFEGVCSTEIWVIKPNIGIDSEWLYWLIQTDQFVNAANKSTGTKMPRAEWGTVKQMEVSVPPTIEEQTAIAAILSDIDAEIDALETKLTKARQIKQGMMQELLTGRIRLI